MGYRGLPYRGGTLWRRSRRACRCSPGADRTGHIRVKAGGGIGGGGGLGTCTASTPRRCRAAVPGPLKLARICACAKSENRTQLWTCTYIYDDVSNTLGGSCSDTGSRLAPVASFPTPLIFHTHPQTPLIGRTILVVSLSLYLCLYL